VARTKNNRNEEKRIEPFWREGRRSWRRLRRCRPPALPHVVASPAATKARSKSRCGGRAAGAWVGSSGGGRAGRGGADLSRVSEREREAGHATFFWIRQ
jgi:hypothetical protein